MYSEKIDSKLNLSLNIDVSTRNKSDELLAGIDENNDVWELIVKYSGDISFIEYFGGTVTYLSGGYAIIKVKQEFISIVESNENIIYIEKPNTIYPNVIGGRIASCISGVQNNDIGLYGNGVICACIDSGIDYSHSVFRNEDGTTRILRLWDQTLEGKPPRGYYIGSEYTDSQINEALINETNRFETVPSRDFSGHGTHVAGIMAGNFAENKNNSLGIATKSPMIIVKLGNTNSLAPITSNLMQAVNYVIETAREFNMPVALNLSYGNTYGSHDGLSLVETFINYAVSTWKATMCVGAGNEGAASGHFRAFIRENEIENIELDVAQFQQSFGIQIWKDFQDEFDIYIKGPASRNQVLIAKSDRVNKYIIDDNEIYVYYGNPKPYSIFQEILIEIIPISDYVTSGIWELEVMGIDVKLGQIDLWLPGNSVLSTRTGFANSTPDVTMTIPGYAYNVITVGGYDYRNEQYVPFSGRGYLRNTNIVKPEIVAPAVEIYSSEPGGYGIRSGTSMATPFATGSAALLMEYGIVDGNDIYLYGEKVKAYLIRGARRIKGYNEWPNNQLGWGALCVSRALNL